MRGGGDPISTLCCLTKTSPDPIAPWEGGTSTSTSQMRSLRIREEAGLVPLTTPHPSHLATQHTDLAMCHQRTRATQLVNGGAGPSTWVLTPGCVLTEDGGAASAGGDLVESGGTELAGQPAPNLPNCLICGYGCHTRPGAWGTGNSFCCVESLSLDLLVPVPPRPAPPS